MPRPNDIASLGPLGPGSVPKGSVEDVSLRSPNRDTVTLSAHVQDPRRSHMASSVGILDAGGLYSSEDVEGALQEIGGSSSTGRQNGVVTGFGYTDVGLVVTFDTPSEANAPTLRDFSGESVTLPDNTPSVWVYIDAASGNISQFVGANPPSIFSPENILLWQFVTLGGAVAAARDARLYVKNLDLKLPIVVRTSGSQEAQESEACFVSLEAALTYLGFSSVLGTKRTEVIIRGEVSTGPVDLPSTADGVVFRGEGGGALVLSSGPYLIDTMGRDRVLFEDLILKTNTVGATAITDSVGTSSALTVNRCDFQVGTQTWVSALDFLGSTGQIVVSNSRMEVVDVGISVANPKGVLVDQVQVSATSGIIGIRIGDLPTTITEGPSTVRACEISGFASGVSVSGLGHVISGNNIFPDLGGTGIVVEDSQNVFVSGNFVDCSQAGGAIGLTVNGAAGSRVVGLQVSNNTFFGAGSYGIQISGDVQESVFTGNQVDCNLPGAPADPTAAAGIFVGPVALAVPSYIAISGNTIWRSKTGIYLAGTQTAPIQEVLVSENLIHHCAVGTAGAPAVFTDISTGVGAQWCVGLSVTSNLISGIGRILPDSGPPAVDPTPANVSSAGIRLEDCIESGVLGNQIRELYQKGAGVSYGVWYFGTGASAPLTDSGLRISYNGLNDIPSVGVILDIGVPSALFARDLDNALISGNTLSSIGIGILLTASGRGTIRSLRVSENSLDNVTASTGISLIANTAALGTPSGVILGADVSGNTLTGISSESILVRCFDDASLSQVRVERNEIQQTGSPGISLRGGSAVGVGATLFEDLSVIGNSLVMPGVLGIAVYLESYVSSTTKIQVSQNTISNTDTGFEFSLNGVGGANILANNFRVEGNSIFATNRGIFGSVAGILIGTSILDNQIQADLEVVSISVGASAPTASSSGGLQVSRNRLTSGGGSNTILDFSNLKVTGIFVEDNVFFNGGAASGGALQLNVTGSATGTSASIRDLLVSRNSFRSIPCEGFVLSVAGPTDPIVDLNLSENVFEAVATDAGVTRASVVRVDADAEIRNFSVRNNKFASCGNSGATHGSLDFTFGGVQGLQVSGNQFDRLPSLGVPYGSLLSLEPSATPGALREVSITGNTSRGVLVPITAATTALLALDLQGFTEVSNISIFENSLNREALPAGSYSGIILITDVLTRGVYCDRNQITGADTLVPIIGDAISMNFSTGVRTLTVSENTVRGTTSNGAQSLGVKVFFGAASQNLRVSGNSIIGDPTSNPTNGIFIQDTGTTSLSDIRVEGNLVLNYIDPYVLQANDLENSHFGRNSAVSFDGTAFEITLTGDNSNLAVLGNISESANAGVGGWSIDLGDSCSVFTFSNNQQILTGGAVPPSTALGITTGTGTNRNFVFEGNIFRGSILGIGYTGSVGSEPQQCTFFGNIGDAANSWSQFANGGTAGWTNVLPPAVSFTNFNIDDGT